MDENESQYPTLRKKCPECGQVPPAETKNPQPRRVPDAGFDPEPLPRWIREQGF